MLRRALDVALRVVALALTISVAASAWHDVSQAFDVGYYHLPFAARLVGLADASTYAFSAENQARFDGFPLLGELLQGLAWRLTGHVAATNLVALAALFAVPVHLRRAHGVPLHLSVLALLAVPLVQTHATSSYVDLPANACVAVLVLALHRVLARRQAPSPRALVGYAVLAAAAANTKFQLVPIVGLVSVALAIVALAPAWRWPSLASDERRALGRGALVLACAAPLVLATPIANVVAHGNPVWPVELHVLGRSLPHVEEAYASSPRHLEQAPRPVRFLHSVLELDAPPIASHRRWSIDQWTPPDEPGFRMGGYFGAYVLVNLAALGVAALRRRSREATTAVAVFGGVTIVAALVPQSHELRYYMHWMLVLVGLNLVLWARAAPRAVGLVAASALAAVAWSTEAAYLRPSGSTIDELVARRVDRSVIDGAAPGERLCLERPPFTFLYAPLFHARKDYAVQEAAADADCVHARRVP